MEKQIQAAVGYLELGMLFEANEEIESLAPKLKTSSPVLCVRMEIYRSAKNWTLMEVVARELWKRHPDDSAYWINLAWATRRSESIEAAQIILLEALEKFPNGPLKRIKKQVYFLSLFLVLHF